MRLDYHEDRYFIGLANLMLAGQFARHRSWAPAKKGGEFCHAALTIFIIESVAVSP
jgi:hypothetical protein